MKAVVGCQRVGGRRRARCVLRLFPMLQKSLEQRRRQTRKYRYATEQNEKSMLLSLLSFSIYSLVDATNAPYQHTASPTPFLAFDAYCNFIRTKSTTNFKKSEAKPIKTSKYSAKKWKWSEKEKSQPEGNNSKCSKKILSLSHTHTLPWKIICYLTIFHYVFFLHRFVTYGLKITHPYKKNKIEDVVR